ncbi:MAG: hypothetical protein R2748_23345 [Bryobacterales bacterium]
MRDALSADVPTVAHYFAERGYQTAAIGKMHSLTRAVATVSSTGSAKTTTPPG